MSDANKNFRVRHDQPQIQVKFGQLTRFQLKRAKL